jgi:Holliday junction resolvase RusA-like endonuclease
VTDANQNAAPWKQQVAGAARAVVGDHAELLTGPLLLRVDFYLARPKGHYGTGRNHGVLKLTAPAYPTTKPDATKLLRGLEDALTGVLWRDDAQIVAQYVFKHYGTPERAVVSVSPMEWTVAAVRSLLELDDGEMVAA